MATGIYDFVDQFATRMTSPEARAASDKDRFRIESWTASLSAIADDPLRGILEEAGPFAGLGEWTRGILAEYGDSEELPYILIGLSMIARGVNPNLFRQFRTLFGC